MACSSHPLPNTFLIPSVCEGTLRIVFDEKCGTEPEVENGRRILKFKKDGFLVLKTDIDDILTTELSKGQNNDFYLVDSKGNKTRLTQIPDFKDRGDITPAIVVGGIGVSSSVVNTTNSQTTLVSGGATYMNFNLYNKNTTEIKDSFSSKKLDSLTNAAVSACRSK